MKHPSSPHEPAAGGSAARFADEHGSEGDCKPARKDYSSNALHTCRCATRKCSLAFLDGLSSAQAADVLGCSLPNLYLQLHRALQRLRKMMEELEIVPGEKDDESDESNT
jgi:hypothetical protein